MSTYRCPSCLMERDSKLFLYLFTFLVHASPSMSTFALNCLLLNEDPKQQSVNVKILKSESVTILKKKIKEEKARQLGHLDASDLILWKVRLLPDQSQV